MSVCRGALATEAAALRYLSRIIYATSHAKPTLLQTQVIRYLARIG